MMCQTLCQATSAVFSPACLVLLYIVPTDHFKRMCVIVQCGLWEDGCYLRYRLHVEPPQSWGMPRFTDTALKRTCAKNSHVN